MKYVGARVRRSEDERLIVGKGRYVADLNLPGTVHAGFVRSPYAHAQVGKIDASEALTLPGVVAVHSSRDAPELGRAAPVHQIGPDLKGHGVVPLAGDVVRYVGEPVAVVLAEDPYVLADAIERVEVRFRSLEPAVDVERAMAGDPLVWDDVPRNVALETSFGFGAVDEAFGRADVVIEERFVFARSAGAAIEPRAVTAIPHGDETPRLTIYDSTQAPHAVRDAIAGYLGLAADHLRVIAPDVGGGFGPKGRVYPEEYVVAAMALRYSRPVTFFATRSEDLLTTAHGGGQVIQATLAARHDGSILAIRHHVIQDLGAYTPLGVGAATNTVRHLIGPYRVPAADIRLTGVYTNKVMTSPLRGGGRQNGIYVVERLLDRLADRLRLDRAEVRRTNFVPAEEFPYDTRMPVPPGGTMVYDSGSYSTYLVRALETIGYEDFPRRQEEARSEGRYLGLGLAAFIESTGTGAEGARAWLREDGAVEVRVGSPSTGQGHASAFAQIVADRIGAPLASIRYLSGDTGAFPWGTGTFASRMGQFGGNAVSMAASALREEILSLAADLLEIAPLDLEIADGRIQAKGVPERGVTLGDVGREAARRGERLEVSRAFKPDRQNTWAGGVNVALVEVDVETGQVNVLRYVVVHDSGTIINPMIVDGQIHGGVVHGIGNAMFEECAYSEDGQMSTSTFVDYMVPQIGDVPRIETVHFETPSPFNPEGIKGAGEGGTIAAIPTIVSAVEDALSPFGITIRDVPIRREELALGSTSLQTTAENIIYQTRRVPEHGVIIGPGERTSRNTARLWPCREHPA